MNMGQHTIESVQARCASVCHSLRFSLRRVNVSHIDTNRHLAFPGCFLSKNHRKRYARMCHPVEFRTSVVGASRQGPEILYTIF